MKSWKLAAAALIATITVSGHALAYTIDDNYIGGDPTHSSSHTDVIGEYKYYDIAGMNVATAGKTMTVDIFTSFVAQTASSTIWSEQTHIGDLFMGTGGWKPYGTAADKYSNDTIDNNQTNWDYVAVFDSHVPTTNGDTTTSGLVKIYSTKDNGSFVESNIGTLNTSQWIYRDGQYVQFTPNANAVALATGTWNINRNAFSANGNTYGDLQLIFDYSTIAAVGNDWAFQWDMTCANDVIQGQTNVPPAVPEPGTMVLLGVGMLGLAIFGKRRIANK